MAPQTSSDVAALRQELATLNCHYHCAPEPPAPLILVRFLGTFEGEDVVWDMRLQTLEHWQRRQGGPGSEPGRQFMHIDREPDGALRIEVTLRVPVIDHPTIRKTIVMIRNYKRLRVGRHEWGG